MMDLISNLKAGVWPNLLNVNDTNTFVVWTLMVSSVQYFNINIQIFECVCLTKDQLKIQIQIKVELKWVDILFTNKVELKWEFYSLIKKQVPFIVSSWRILTLGTGFSVLPGGFKQPDKWTNDCYNHLLVRKLIFYPNHGECVSLLCVVPATNHYHYWCKSYQTLFKTVLLPPFSLS